MNLNFTFSKNLKHSANVDSGLQKQSILKMKSSQLLISGFRFLYTSFSRYVPFQSTDSQGGSTPTSNASKSPTLGSGSPTPVVMSPMASSCFSDTSIPTPKASSGEGGGYISVDEAINKLKRASELEPHQITNTVSDPRAYSRVTLVNPSNTSTNSNASLVMSAKDLHFVTNVDGGGPMTNSTMV